MYSTQIICLLTALSCLTSAAPAPAPAMSKTSSLDRRWDGSSWWQSSEWHTSWIDFSWRRSDGQSSVKCDLRNAKMPTASPPLPPPSSGLYLTHVAVGRGTQNYTCDTTNTTAVPVAIGALAVLYNASCIAADSPALLDKLPVVALNLATPSSSDPNSPANLDTSGHHYFLDATTAYFNLDTSSHDYGAGAFKKVNATAAPTGAPVGQAGSGNGAVPWLKLVAKSANSQALQEVYRLNTAGGNPPKSCAGQAASFQVQYSAEYWVWAK